MGVCCAASILLAGAGQATDDSHAIEVESQGAAASGDSTSASSADPRADDSIAHEVPPAFSTARRSESPVIAAVDDGFVLIDPEDNYDRDTLSQLYEQSFHPDYDYSNTGSYGDSYDYGANAAAESFAPERWEISGEIGFISGSSTYSDNESQGWELREKLKARSGNSYEFYQRYDVDHSYVSSGEYVLGARQKLKDLLWGGSLDMTEEFTQYKDRNDKNNDRQEGLFKLRFDPEWNNGRTKADIEYKYNIKEYEVFSPRSYKLNSGKLRLTQKFDDDLTGSVTGRFDSYDYSLGSTRGNRKSSLGTDWEYRASDELTLTAGLESEQKTYSVRKTRDYEQLETKLGARYQPDEDSYVSADYKHTDYVGTFSPSRSYNEDRLAAYYQRHLTEELEASLRVSERRKRFDLDPSDDLDQHTYNIGLNYNPNEVWNFSASLGNDEYAYANPARVYSRRDYQLGAGYTYCDLRLSADYSRSSTDYQALPLQSYDSDTISTTLDYEFERSRLSLSYSLSKLDQADPASFNDYDQSSFSGSWEYELDPDTDLRLSYDSSNRSYDAQPGVRDTTLEAKLSFEL